MVTFVLVLHLLVCVALILIVLLQTGKGAEIGAAFGGGGSSTLFGSRGAGTFLSKLTAAAAAIFMLTSLYLAMNSAHISVGSVVKEAPVSKEAPAKPAPAAPAQSAPAGPAPAFPAPQGGK